MWLAPAWLEGREVIAVFEDRRRSKPSYLMWLEVADGRISFIRDYRYVRYVTDDAELVLASGATPAGDGNSYVTVRVSNWTIAEMPRRPSNVYFWQILLQKSFWGGERKFSEPLMRFPRGGVRDHIVSSKIDHGPP